MHATQNELAESGFTNDAKCQLMRDETKEYTSYIEQEARSLGLLKDDYVDVSKYVRKLSYDFKEQKKGNTLITGMNQVGKSRLAMLLASRLAENIYRIMSVGANQKIRVIAITPSMSLIDAFFIRLCGQRFHFRLSIEENSLRKFRRYYGNDYTRMFKA